MNILFAKLTIVPSGSVVAPVILENSFSGSWTWARAAAGEYTLTNAGSLEECDVWTNWPAANNAIEVFEWDQERPLRIELVHHINGITVKVSDHNMNTVDGDVRLNIELRAYPQ